MWKCGNIEMWLVEVSYVWLCIFKSPVCGGGKNLIEPWLEASHTLSTKFGQLQTLITTRLRTTHKTKVSLVFIFFTITLHGTRLDLSRIIFNSDKVASKSEIVLYMPVDTFTK